MSIANLQLQTSSVTGIPMVTEDQKTISFYFTFQLTGTYAAGGDTLDLTQLAALAAGAPGSSLTTAANPLAPLELESIESPGPANLYEYHYAPGTTQANGKVQVFTGAAAQTALTELSAGAYPAGVTADTISGKVTFPKL